MILDPIQLVELQPALYRRALQLTRNPTVAEDLVQATITLAWAARTSFKPGTNLGSWTFTILRNRFLSDHRREKYNGGSTDDPSWVDSNTVEPGCDERIDLKRVQSLLPRLPRQQRETLLLSTGGWKYDDIADALEIPTGTVRSSISRGRDALETLLLPKAA